jgi:hypothetical protein
MPRDLRDLLEAGAGQPIDLPHAEELWERGRRRTRRRQALAVAATLAAIVVVGAVAERSWLPTSASRDADPAQEPSVEAMAPLRVGQLEPGTYRSEGWAREFSFKTWDDGWRVVENDRGWLSLVRGSDTLQVASWTKVLDPRASRAEPSAFVTAPDDLAPWLADHPRLRTSSRATDLGGVTAVMISAVVIRPLATELADCSGEPCAPLARLGTSDALATVVQGQQAVLLVVGEPGKQVVISYAAPPRRFVAADAAARRLLETLRFTAPR